MKLVLLTESSSGVQKSSAMWKQMMYSIQYTSVDCRLVYKRLQLKHTQTTFVQMSCFWGGCKKQRAILPALHRNRCWPICMNLLRQSFKEAFEKIEATNQPSSSALDFNFNLWLYQLYHLSDILNRCASYLRSIACLETEHSQFLKGTWSTENHYIVPLYLSILFLYTHNTKHPTSHPILYYPGKHHLRGYFCVATQKEHWQANLYHDINGFKFITRQQPPS